MLQQLEPVLQIRLMLMQNITPNATTTVLGKIQLSGDLTLRQQQQFL